MRNRRGAVAPIALAHHIFRRGHPTVLDQPVKDDPRQVLHVGLDLEKGLLGFGLIHQTAGIAGADRIDEHHVGEIEPRAGIVDQGGGVGGGVALCPELDTLWPDGSKVQVNRCCTRPAVEGEGDWAFGVFRAIQHIGGEHHLSDLLALLVAHRQRADGGGIVQRLAGHVGDLLDRGVGGEGRQVDLVLGLFGLGGGVCGEGGQTRA